MISKEQLWRNILENEGVEFTTKRGLAFTYKVEGGSIRPIRKGQGINRVIPKTDFEKGIKAMPINGPGDIGNLVQGSSYVWALLHDKRIVSDSVFISSGR